VGGVGRNKPIENFGNPTSTMSVIIENTKSDITPEQMAGLNPNFYHG
jgi:hypothetical protein